LTLSYGKNDAIILKNLKVEKQFADAFTQLYSVGDTIEVVTGLFKTRVVKIDKKKTTSEIDSMWQELNEDEDEEIAMIEEKMEFINYEKHLRNCSSPYAEDAPNYISDELLSKVKAEREIALEGIKTKWLEKNKEGKTSKVNKFENKAVTTKEKKTSKW